MFALPKSLLPSSVRLSCLATGPRASPFSRLHKPAPTAGRLASVGDSDRGAEASVSPLHDVPEEMRVLNAWARANTVPSLRQMAHFINLTNGIEAIPTLEALRLPYSIVRMQSTACEQGHLLRVLDSLEPQLLLYLALGKPVMIWDLGSRGRSGCPRSLWYGAEWTRYALTRLWTPDVPVKAHLRGVNASKMFEEFIRNSLPDSTHRKLAYYKKFLRPADGSTPRGPVPLYGAFRPTVNDPDFDFFVRLLHSRYPVLSTEACGAQNPAGDAVFSGGAASAASAADARQTGVNFGGCQSPAALGGDSSDLLGIHPADALEKVGYAMFVPGLAKWEFNSMSTGQRGVESGETGGDPGSSGQARGQGQGQGQLQV